MTLPHHGVGLSADQITFHVESRNWCAIKLCTCENVRLTL